MLARTPTKHTASVRGRHVRAVRVQVPRARWKVGVRDGRGGDPCVPAPPDSKGEGVPGDGRPLRGVEPVFYEVTLRRPVEVCELARMRHPKALSGSEVERLLGAVSTKKHRAMRRLACGAGPGVSEVVRLEVGALDAKRMLGHVRASKRRREPYVMLSSVLVAALRTACASLALLGALGDRAKSV